MIPKGLFSHLFLNSTWFYYGGSRTRVGHLGHSVCWHYVDLFPVAQTWILHERVVHCMVGEAVQRLFTARQISRNADGSRQLSEQAITMSDESRHSNHPGRFVLEQLSGDPNDFRDIHTKRTNALRMDELIIFQNMTVYLFCGRFNNPLLGGRPCPAVFPTRAYCVMSGKRLGPPSEHTSTGLGVAMLSSTGKAVCSRQLCELCVLSPGQAG